MKKIMLMALMSMMALGASAQMLTSRTYTKTKRPTTWYVRAGASFNNVAGMSDAEYSEDGDELSLGTKTGFVADFGFQKPIGKSGLYWGMELGLGNRGYSVNIKEDDIESKLSLLTWNLTYSPVTIGYKYSVTDNLKIDAHFGIFASYDFAHNLSAKAGGEKYDIDWDRFSSETSYTEFDAGIQLGIGVWYSRYNLDFTWQRGFSELSYYSGNPSGATGRSSNLMLRLGIAF